MKHFNRFLALVAFLTFAAHPTEAATAIYNKTVSVTSTNTVVTPTTAFPTFVTVANDGTATVYVDFDRVAVADSTTAIRLLPCQSVDISLDKSSFTTMGLITASSTATAQVTAHYLAGTYPQVTDTNNRLRFYANPACSVVTLLPAYGAAVASATALPAPVAQNYHVTGTTTITSITSTGIVAGTRIVLIFDGSLTFTDGSNLVLAGNFSATADDTITLVFDGTNWVEISRSAN